MKTTETVYLKKIWFLVWDTNPVYSNTIGCARDVYRHYNSKITWFIFSHRAICVRDFCRILPLTIASNVWLIDWIVFYAASAIFQPYNGGDSWLKVISFEILKCPWRPHESTLLRNPVKWSFACQGGCYPWHGAPFDVLSDGQKKN